MHQALLVSPLIVMVVLVVVYVSDYSLTVHAARLYKAGANEVIVLDGSYELNPLFAPDIDRLRRISPRFLGMLVLYSLFIWAVWYFSVRLANIPQIYAFAIGAILLLQGPIHVRHARNIMIFRRAKDRDGIAGQIEYSRLLGYATSATELWSFAGLYLVLGLLVPSWLLVGGAFGCAVLALRHYRLSHKTAGSGQSE